MLATVHPSRSSHGKLQAEAQDAGEVLRYDRAPAGADHPGWYWRPKPMRGCRCDHCVAGRAGRASYLGYHDRGALLELGAHRATHPPLYV